MNETSWYIVNDAACHVVGPDQDAKERAQIVWRLGIEKEWSFHGLP